jgi:uncharacterized membrane protein
MLQGYSVTSPRENTVINICICFAFLLILSWIWTLYLSNKQPQPLLWIVPISDIFGLLNCLVGLLLTEVREGII